MTCWAGASSSPNTWTASSAGRSPTGCSSRSFTCWSGPITPSSAYRYVRIDENGKVVEREAVTPAGAPKVAEPRRRGGLRRRCNARPSIGCITSRPILPTTSEGQQGFYGLRPAVEGHDHVLQGDVLHDAPAGVLDHSRPGAEREFGGPAGRFGPAIPIVYRSAVARAALRELRDADPSVQVAGTEGSAEAYQTGTPKPLKFHIGYGLARLPSNLLFATREDLAVQAKK